MQYQPVGYHSNTPGAPPHMLYQQQPPQMGYYMPQPMMNQQMYPQVFSTLKTDPFQTTCQFCGHNGYTEVVGKVSKSMWYWTLGLLLVGLLVGFTWLCMFLPFCYAGNYDFIHSCESCH